MATTITRLFDSYDDARQAVNTLESGGIAHDRISLVANNEASATATRTATAPRTPPTRLRPGPEPGRRWELCSAAARDCWPAWE